ncbi:MAG: TIM barrel protein [Burkholderiales bacterium]|jgi:sugar phosphate isomerase/epimerase|nr:TIM barrel protein [Burkholderiales bacterium]
MTTRAWSLAYLTTPTLRAAEMLRTAHAIGYGFVGLRIAANLPGTPYQALVDAPAELAELKAVMADTGTGVFDLEIIRIGERFDVTAHLPMLDVGQAIGARAVLVAADDTDTARLADSYARLCEAMAPRGLTADLEFMPWTAVKTAREALAVVRAAGHPSNAGVLVDALHYARSGTTLADIAALPRDLLHYAQACDAPAPPGHRFTDDELVHTARSERLMPGEGGIDLRGLFGALPAGLPVSVEIPHLQRQAALPPIEFARQALAAARAVLDPPA